jgi:hypothetical protein
MDKIPANNCIGERLPQPVVLRPVETREVAGGINPQPLPPREDRPSAKSE